MKVNYYSDTGSPYIDPSERSSVEGRELSEGVMFDDDSSGRLMGIEIDNAADKVELQNGSSAGFTIRSKDI